MNLCKLLETSSTELLQLINDVKEEKAGDSRIQKKVQAILQQLDAAVPTALLEENDKKRLGAFFFETLASLSEKVFDRSSLNRLHGLKRELISLCTDTPMKEGKSSLIERIEQEAKIALALGIPPERGGGVSESFILKDIEGKKIAIFKPTLLGPRSKHNSSLKSRMSRLVSRLMGYHSIRHHRESFWEVFSYRASKRLQFDLVPPTSFASFSSKSLGSSLQQKAPLEGSLQLFVPGMKEAGEVLHRSEKCFFNAVIQTLFRLLKSLFTPSLLAQLEKKCPLPEKVGEINQNDLSKKLVAYFVLFDFLTGQNDRHWDNWMVNVEDIEKQSVYGVEVRTFLRTEEEGKRCIVAIDNGSCLPRSTPQFLEDHHMYLQCELDIAKIGITKALDEEERKRIHDELDGVVPDFMNLALSMEFKKEHLEKIKDALLRGDANPDLPFSQKEKKQYEKVLNQLSLLQSRIQVLKVFLLPPKQLEGHYTFKLLASLKQEAEYMRFLHASRL
jgi:hypothetical protein